MENLYNPYLRIIKREHLPGRLMHALITAAMGSGNLVKNVNEEEIGKDMASVGR